MSTDIEATETWLDGQVMAGAMTPGQAQQILPGYTPPYIDRAPRVDEKEDGRVSIFCCLRGPRD